MVINRFDQRKTLESRLFQQIIRRLVGLNREGKPLWFDREMVRIINW